MEEDQGNILRIDVHMDDVDNMIALIAGLIGIVTAKSGGVKPERLYSLLASHTARTPSPTNRQNHVPSPTNRQNHVPSPTNRQNHVPSPTNHQNHVPSPTQLSLDEKHNLMDSFIENYCTYKDGCRIKSSELRTKFNDVTGLNESHVSFSRLMDSYYGKGHIEKKHRGDGKWYDGIGWCTKLVMIPVDQSPLH